MQLIYFFLSFFTAASLRRRKTADTRSATKSNSWINDSKSLLQKYKKSRMRKDKMDLILVDCSSVYPEKTKPRLIIRPQQKPSAWEYWRAVEKNKLSEPEGIATIWHHFTKYISIIHWRWRSFFNRKVVFLQARESHGWHEIICNCIKNLATKGGVE